MTHALRRAASLTLLCVTLGGCGALRNASTTPTTDEVESEWRTVAVQAGQEVQAGRYGAADRLLADFATRYAGTDPGAEALFRRALYRLDPANSSGSIREAEAMLDVYLASPLSIPRRNDAAALRRLAAALDARPAVVTVTTPASGGAKDEELGRLKDELAKANAELERIKRRLAAPKP
jgi:hypothetical protein